jgi:5-formyltetrahydrofolate cyclo-ligase
VTSKADARGRALGVRAARSQPARDVARTQIRSVLRDWLTAAELAPGSRIAAYEPLRTEPGSVELLADLTNAGYVVLVPVTLSDKDLDWTVWTGTGENRRTLGVDAIGSASLVLVPALAVDPVGNRLGRGGGSYDRALTRIAAGTPVAALLFAGEVLAQVPTDPWDHPVTAVITPDGWQNLPVPA